MGGRFPEMVKRAAPFAGTAKTSDHCKIFLKTLIDAIKSDPTFNGGFYSEPHAVHAGLRRHADLFALMGACQDLYVTSAMRRGEIAGLKWKDVDLDEGFLWVKKTLENTKEHGLVLKKPKTKTSKRKIHLPALAVSALIAHKADQNALRLRSGFGKGGERFVFETFRDDQFGPVRPRALTKIFSSFIAGVDVPRITLHSLRHTAATSAIRAGENIVAVSKRLGAGTTLAKNYTGA